MSRKYTGIQRDKRNHSHVCVINTVNIVVIATRKDTGSQSVLKIRIGSKRCLRCPCMKLVHQGNARDDDEHTQPRRSCVWCFSVFYVIDVIIVFFVLVFSVILCGCFLCFRLPSFSLTLSPHSLYSNYFYRLFRLKMLEVLT